MTHEIRLRGTFLAFHLILGLALLWASVHTMLFAAGDMHARVIGSAEAAGAVAFLVPGTLRAGVALLLVTILVAGVIHAARGEWRPDLLVYAAGVVLVGVHGSAWPEGGSAARAGGAGPSESSASRGLPMR